MADSSGAIGLIGAGLIGTAGALYNNRQNIKYQKQANAMQVELANTAHQREVRDLIAAGLNPVLSASGSGSSVPSLGTPSTSNPSQPLADSISSASKYLSEEYKENVESLKVNNEQMRTVNSALKQDRKVLDVEREIEELQAEERLKAQRELLGLPKYKDPDGVDIQRETPAYKAYKLALKTALMANVITPLSNSAKRIYDVFSIKK